MKFGIDRLIEELCRLIEPSLRGPQRRHEAEDLCPRQSVPAGPLVVLFGAEEGLDCRFRFTARRPGPRRMDAGIEFQEIPISGVVDYRPQLTQRILGPPLA